MTLHWILARRVLHLIVLHNLQNQRLFRALILEDRFDLSQPNPVLPEEIPFKISMSGWMLNDREALEYTRKKLKSHKSGNHPFFTPRPTQHRYRAHLPKSYPVQGWDPGWFPYSHPPTYYPKVFPVPDQ